MADAPPSPERRARGFQRAGGIVAPRLKAVALRRGFAEARLLTHWVEIAGSDIAAATRPVKMTRPRGHGGGTLTIAAEGARAPEVQMMLPTLRARVNAALGWPAVARIHVTQGRPGGFFAEPAAPWEPLSAEPPPPDPHRLAPLITQVSSIGDGGLRAALETLARNVLSRSATVKKPGSR